MELIFSKTRVYDYDDRQAIIVWRLRRSIATILRARSRHDYDRDVLVGDQWSAKCERRLIQAIKGKKKCVNKACGGDCSRVIPVIRYISKLENIIIQFERDIYSKNIP